MSVYMCFCVYVFVYDQKLFIRKNNFVFLCVKEKRKKNKNKKNVKMSKKRLKN